MSVMFDKRPLKAVKVVDYINSKPYSAKRLPKYLSFKSRNLVEFGPSSIKNPHAYSDMFTISLQTL